MKHTIFEEDEKKSKYGIPHELARMWFWSEWTYAENGKDKETTTNRGCLRASTESEALARLREAFPKIKGIQWIHRSDYR